jgi:hypothetical protein
MKLMACLITLREPLLVSANQTFSSRHFAQLKNLRELYWEERREWEKENDHDDEQKS